MRRRRRSRRPVRGAPSLSPALRPRRSRHATRLRLAASMRERGSSGTSGAARMRSAGRSWATARTRRAAVNVVGARGGTGLERSDQRSRHPRAPCQSCFGPLLDVASAFARTDSPPARWCRSRADLPSSRARLRGRRRKCCSGSASLPITLYGQLVCSEQPQDGALVAAWFRWGSRSPSGRACRQATSRTCTRRRASGCRASHATFPTRCTGRWPAWVCSRWMRPWSRRSR